MTPKEKAIELVNKFRDFANGTDYETDGFNPNIEKENGKQCAFILIDEILNYQSILLEYFPSKEYNPTYWQEVKQEIEKL